MVQNEKLFERFALIGGADASIYDVRTGELESVFENCNSLELTVKGEKIEIKEKGAVAMGIPKPKTCELKFIAETTTFSKLALSLGSSGFELNTEQDTYTKNEKFIVKDKDSITYSLSTEVSSEKDIRVFLTTSDGELVKALDFNLDVAKKMITVTPDPDVEVGDCIRINYEALVPVGKMYQFKVNSKSNNGTKRVVIDAISLNTKDKSKILMQIEIYKVSILEGITLTMDGEKPSSFEVSMDVLADYNLITDVEGSQFFRYKVLLDD